MKPAHQFSYRTIVPGLALATLSIFGAPALATAQDNPLSAKIIQDRDYPSRSNTEAGRRILTSAPPVVPGYRQFMGFIFAVVEGKAKLVPFAPPVPENVSAHPDLTYRTVGNKELKLDLYRPKATLTGREENGTDRIQIRICF